MEECYIRKVSRNHKMFLNRSIRIYVPGGGNPETVIPVPNDSIVCDSCNDLIDTPQIGLLVINDRVWGTVCDKCKIKYHSELKEIEN